LFGHERLFTDAEVWIEKAESTSPVQRSSKNAANAFYFWHKITDQIV